MEGSDVLKAGGCHVFMQGCDCVCGGKIKAHNVPVFANKNLTVWSEMVAENVYE